MADTSAFEGLRLIAPYVAGVLSAGCVLALATWFGRDALRRALAAVAPSGQPADGAIAVCVLVALGTMAFFASIELVATELFFAGRSIVPEIVIVAGAIAGAIVLLGTRPLVAIGHRVVVGGAEPRYERRRHTRAMSVQPAHGLRGVAIECTP